MAYGNLDVDQLYEVKELSELNCFIVRQVQVQQTTNGEVEIVPPQIQTYSTDIWKREYSGVIYFFNEIGMKFTILNDPTIL